MLTGLITIIIQPAVLYVSPSLTPERMPTAHVGQTGLFLSSIVIINTTNQNNTILNLSAWTRMDAYYLHVLQTVADKVVLIFRPQGNKARI